MGLTLAVSVSSSFLSAGDIESMKQVLVRPDKEGRFVQLATVEASRPPPGTARSFGGGEGALPVRSQDVVGTKWKRRSLTRAGLCHNMVGGMRPIGRAQGSGGRKLEVRRHCGPNS